MSELREEGKSLMSLEEVLRSTGGTLVGNADDFFFTSVATDSRNVKKNTLFVPLVGEKQDGHKYVPQAIESGASVIFINKSEYEDNKQKYDKLAGQWSEKSTNLQTVTDSLKTDRPVCGFVCFIAVENTLHGLQDAARGYVEKFPNLIKCAITGSSGKTTTKEMVVSVLKQKYNCVYTQGNFNSETGLPLSVFNIRSEHECGIFEMGMNRQNEIGEIANVLKPKYAIITNIGNAHIGILGSRENIAAEKRKIFDYIPSDGAAFVPVNDDYVDYITENVRGKIVKFGKSVSPEISGVEYKKGNGLFGTTFILNGLEINLPISGEYNYQNALSAVAIAKELGVTDEKIKAGLESFHNVGGRMEIVQTELKGGIKATIVKDCYNANPDSMAKVIELCANQKIGGKKIFVLGDMKELGEKAVESHKEILSLVEKYGIDVTAFVGSDFRDAIYCDENKLTNGSFENFGLKNIKAISVETVEDVELEKFVLENATDDSLILLKGSNSMKLWELLPKIENEKAKENEQEAK